MRLSLIFLVLKLWGNVEVSLTQNACSKLPDVPHSHVSEDTRKDEYQDGNVIDFTCETGYISGLTITYICTKGNWRALRQGTCYLKPCELPDDTPNGYYEIIHGEEFVFGTTIKYLCNAGYQMMSKEDTRTCLLDGWTNHVPICRTLSCEPPPADGGIIVEGLPDNYGPILPDRFLTFSCEGPGKYLNGSSLLICGKDGVWNNPVPSCEDITCEVEEIQPHLIVVGLAPEMKTIKTGQKLRFYCDNQLTVDGSEEIECLQTGKWNAVFPTCIEKCKVADLSRTVRLTTHLPGNQLKKGQMLRFACVNPRDTLRGKATVECLADGQWSDQFPTCGAPLDCRSPPPLADGDTKRTLQSQYRHGQRVEYICQNYYLMEGEPYKTCSNGEWIGQMRCLKPCTVDRVTMNMHNIIFRYTTDDKLYSEHNDQIQFTCKGRTSHVGIVGMRQTCVEGVMQLPTCQ